MINIDFIYLLSPTFQQKYKRCKYLLYQVSLRVERTPPDLADSIISNTFLSLYIFDRNTREGRVIFAYIDYFAGRGGVGVVVPYIEMVSFEDKLIS